MLWDIPKLLAALAVGSFFSPVFTNPTSDVEPWKSHSIENDFEIRSYGAQLSYVKRGITGPFPVLSEHPDFKTNPNDNGGGLAR
ncbi:hypothetical protein BDV29DRAFT_101785 [Aspergillus leporis]|uniref:Uncharacterized protein n=1 Tax=Aspergillus leporis TaxID=41062 RepID=A0A5N5WIX1_9EURO|nr:hypothetical protein BDV29DRAFT_101785 [Aspergillus leporis]